MKQYKLPVIIQQPSEFIRSFKEHGQALPNAIEETI